MSSNCQSVLLQDWTLFYNLETNGLSLPCYSRKELSDLWDKCFFGPAQREEFTPAFDGMCDIIHCAARKLHCFLQPHSQASLRIVWDEYRRETWEWGCVSSNIQTSRLGSKTKVFKTLGGVLKLKLRVFFAITEQFLGLWLVKSVMVNN